MGREALLVAVGVVLVAVPRAAGATDDCRPWPGEFSPLPTVASLDPLAAEWARLRTAELARAARERETVAPVDAYRLYGHIRCLDPQNAEAAAALERLEPRIVVVRRPRSPARLSQLDGGLARAEALIAEARFRDALESLSSLREALGELEPSTEVGRRRVRLEVLEATTWVAFGDAEAAQESLERALFVDPRLRFDERQASPKLRRALDAARRRTLGDPGGES
jgi:hypothetical protein